MEDYNYSIDDYIRFAENGAADALRVETGALYAAIAQAKALASIAESLARLSLTVSDEETLSGRTVPVLLATNPFTY